MRTRLVGLLLLAVAFDANAQIISSRFPARQPSIWGTIGAGYSQGWTVLNGGQSWDFGEGTQVVASLEKTVSPGASIGVAVTTAHLPVRVTNNGVADDEDANVSQGFATLHVANAAQFHTAFDLRAGITSYNSFTSRTAGVTSPVTGQDIDFSFALGYGFGYAFSRSFSIDVMQDVTTSIHQKDGLSAGAANSVRLHTTRIVGRFGL